MKTPSDAECVVLVEQSGFQYRMAIYAPEHKCLTQTLSLKELNNIARHAFIAGQEHAERKANKK